MASDLQQQQQQQQLAGQTRAGRERERERGTLSWGLFAASWIIMYGWMYMDVLYGWIVWMDCLDGSVLVPWLHGTSSTMINVLDVDAAVVRADEE